MKNKIFIVSLFFIFGCSSYNTTSNNTPLNEVTCPSILVSSEHQKYITGNSEPITFEDLSFISDINNYEFSSGCYSNKNFNEAELSILFIVNPEKIINPDFLIPYYIAILNDSDELLEIIYSSFKGSIEKNKDTNDYVETEIIENLFIKLPYKDNQEFSKLKIIIGFMLKKESFNLLN